MPLATEYFCLLLQPDAGRLETAAKIAENIGGRDIALPGAKSLVAFVAAWDSLVRCLMPCLCYTKFVPYTCRD